MCFLLHQGVYKRAMRSFGAVLGVLVLVILGFCSYQSAQPHFVVSYYTQADQVVQKALPDGSWLRVEKDSVVQLRFYERTRKAELVEGSALFFIQADRQRPFYLKLGRLEISVAEGQVLLRRDAEKIDVEVLKGVVHVQVGRWWPEQYKVESGQQLRWLQDNAVLEISR